MKKELTPVVSVLALAFMFLSCSAEYEAWRKASGKNTAEGYEQFVSEFPESSHSAEAARRLDALSHITVDGRLRMFMSMGDAFSQAVPDLMVMRLTPSITIETNKGEFKVFTTEQTSFVNLIQIGGAVSYVLDDDAVYSITGKLSRDGSRTIVADQVILLETAVSPAEVKANERLMQNAINLAEPTSNAIAACGVDYDCQGGVYRCQMKADGSRETFEVCVVETMKKTR